MSKSFNTLVREVLKTRVPHRLLCVFIETKDASDTSPILLKAPPRADEEASWIRVCTSAHMAVTQGLSFADLLETADTHDRTWTTVVVAACHNPDRSMPSEQDANVYLANMRQRILAGDRAGLVEIDRTGHVVSWEDRGQLRRA